MKTNTTRATFEATVPEFTQAGNFRPDNVRRVHPFFFTTFDAFPNEVCAQLVTRCRKSTPRLHQFPEEILHTCDGAFLRPQFGMGIDRIDNRFCCHSPPISCPPVGNSRTNGSKFFWFLLLHHTTTLCCSFPPPSTTLCCSFPPPSRFPCGAGPAPSAVSSQFFPLPAHLDIGVSHCTPLLWNENVCFQHASLVWSVTTPRAPVRPRCRRSPSQNRTWCPYDWDLGTESNTQDFGLPCTHVAQLGATQRRVDAAVRCSAEDMAKTLRHFCRHGCTNCPNFCTRSFLSSETHPSRWKRHPRTSNDSLKSKSQVFPLLPTRNVVITSSSCLFSTTTPAQCSNPSSLR